MVTSFTYRLHPVTAVLADALTHPWSTARDVLRHYHAFMATAPDELSSAASLGLDPAGTPAVTLLVCWSGDPAEGERVLRPLRSFGPPLDDSIGVLPYLDWQRAPDPGYPRGRRHYWKSGYLRHLSDAALDALLAVVPTIPAPETGIVLQGLRGAAARVLVDATAFPHRAEQYDLLILAQWADPARTDEHFGWARAAFDTLRPHLGGLRQQPRHGGSRARPVRIRPQPFPAGRAQAHLRPREPAPPQPERATGLTVTDPMPRARRRSVAWPAARRAL